MHLQFDNSFARHLPADPVQKNQRRQVFGACYSAVVPTAVSAPYLLAHSESVASRLGLSRADVCSKEFLEVFSGNRVLPEMAPLAACYGGHQFGNWAGQLGDGRAISLGQVRAKDGSLQELQLKGAGPTPYSRSADGRAVLRSSLREFLCSEAMHSLGVPTTRALCLLGTGDWIARDLLYDGNVRLEPGAIVCRVAPSFLRFGNFEIFAARDDLETQRTLANYTIEQHFPELHTPGEPLTPETYTRWFEVVCERTALLVAHWMRVGFVHGVLNTDNMSVLGLTIDYGPYGWLEGYDPNWTPNTTDAAGRRYRYGYQPRIAGWNLARFAEALLPLGCDLERMQSILSGYEDHFTRFHGQMQRDKLGLTDTTPAGVCESPEQLHEDLLQVLRLAETDVTLFYRNLAHVDVTEAAFTKSDDSLCEPLLVAYYNEPSRDVLGALATWLRRYARRVLDEARPAEQRKQQMLGANPKYVLRNYLAQLAIDRAEQGDASLVETLLGVLQRPYDEQPEHEQYAAKRPEWARVRAGCSMLSCSS